LISCDQEDASHVSAVPFELPEPKTLAPELTPYYTTLTMENLLFNLKFTANQLERSSKKSEKNEKKEQAKVKKAIEKGNDEGAWIYAQNAIREKNQALNFLRLASRVDAVASRVATAVRMYMLTKNMGSVVKGMDKVVGAMDTEEIGLAMDKFEKQFEDMDVRAAYMEGAIGKSTAMSTPVEEVDALMHMVADEHGLNLAGQLDDAGAMGTHTQADAAVAAAAPAPGSLDARLAALHAKA